MKIIEVNELIGMEMMNYLIKKKFIHLLILFFFTLIFIHNINSIPVEPLEKILTVDNSKTSKYILDRVPTILMCLRKNFSSDKKLKQLISRIRVSAPTRSYYELSPNAFALPGKDHDFIIIEANLINQIVAQATIGALFATHWKDAPGIFDKFCTDFKRTYQQVLKQGKDNIAIYQFKFDDYLGKQKDVNRLWIDKLHAIIVDEAIIWVVLHEVGHLALGHKTENITNLYSRIREIEADAWAFSAMKKLGYSLFGLSQYLKGRAYTEQCLMELNLVIPETQSTHPSYLTRYNHLKMSYDISAAPNEDYRSFFMPITIPLPIEMYLYVSSPRSDDYRVVINQNYNIVNGICEWNADTVYIYTRSNTGGRLEFIIPNASRIFNLVTMKEYNSSGNLVSIFKVPSIQLNTISLNYLQIGNGLTPADISEKVKDNNVMTFHLKKIGISKDVISKALQAMKQYKLAEKQIIVNYMKGKINFVSLKPLITPVINKYREDLIRLLGVKNYNNYQKSIMNDPLVQWKQQWESGSGSDYKKLEDDLIKKNFPFE